MALKLGRQFDHFAETVFHALINLIKSSTKVMSTAGLLACRFIVKVVFCESCETSVFWIFFA